MVEPIAELIERNMLLPTLSMETVDSDQLMQRAVGASMGIGPKSHDACVVLQARVERSQQSGLEMARQIQELERQLEEDRLKRAELQTLLAEEKAKTEHLTIDLGDTLAKMNEVIHTRDQGIAAAEEACVRSEENRAKVELRILDLESSHLDLNDQLIAREEEAYALRKFVTMQAARDNDFVREELKKRLGYVPIKVEQFVFDSIPAGLATADALDRR